MEKGRIKKHGMEEKKRKVSEEGKMHRFLRGENDHVHLKERQRIKKNLNNRTCHRGFDQL